VNCIRRDIIKGQARRCGATGAAGTGIAVAAGATNCRLIQPQGAAGRFAGNHVGQSCRGTRATIVAVAA
jgi:hypothetical protein